MARIVRHNDESVREGYIRNGGKEVKLFTSALKAFHCNNRIVIAQRKHLDDFLRGRIIGRLECGRTQQEVSEELGIAQSIIPGFDNDFKMMLPSATDTTVSRQTVYRLLGYIGLYARRPVRCVPLTATDCRLRLTWSREHALRTPQQWSCVMFSDESRFSLQFDSRRTLIWRAPGTRYHQENAIERHRFGGAGWLVWREIILGSRTDLHVQSATMTDHIYWDSFWNNMYVCFGAPWVLNFCLWMTTLVLTVNPIEHVWDMLGRRIAAHQPRLGVVRPVLHRPGDILRINHHTNHVILFFVNRFFFEICSRIRVWVRCGEMSNPATSVERPTSLHWGIMVWDASHTWTIISSSYSRYCSGSMVSRSGVSNPNDLEGHYGKT
ncbi:transposable element Tcb2 transposase [Trichonephila clavipes]|nr:transposable element Tcb2 transposase [Trichonephila clavipes]